MIVIPSAHKDATSDYEEEADEDTNSSSNCKKKIIKIFFNVHGQILIICFFIAPGKVEEKPSSSLRPRPGPKSKTTGAAAHLAGFKEDQNKYRPQHSPDEPDGLF